MRHAAIGTTCLLFITVLITLTSAYRDRSLEWSDEQYVRNDADTLAYEARDYLWDAHGLQSRQVDATAVLLEDISTRDLVNAIKARLYAYGQRRPSTNEFHARAPETDGNGNPLTVEVPFRCGSTKVVCKKKWNTKEDAQMCFNSHERAATPDAVGESRAKNQGLKRTPKDY